MRDIRQALLLSIKPLCVGPIEWSAVWPNDSNRNSRRATQWSAPTVLTFELSGTRMRIRIRNGFIDKIMHIYFNAAVSFGISGVPRKFSRGGGRNLPRGPRISQSKIVHPKRAFHIVHHIRKCILFQCQDLIWPRLSVSYCSSFRAPSKTVRKSCMYT